MEEEKDLLSNSEVQIKGESDSKDIMIFMGVILFAIASIYWFVMRKYVDSTENYDIYDTMKVYSRTISFGTAIAPLLVAFGAWNKKWKILAIVFASMSTLIQLYWLFKSIYEDF